MSAGARAGGWRRGTWLLVAFAVLLLGIAAWQTALGLAASARVREAVAWETSVGSEGAPLERLEALAASIERLHAPESTEQLDLGGPWKILKAGPADVADVGGHCGNLSRLFITRARMEGFEARRIHLYNPDGLRRTRFPEAYVHATVEVEVDGRWGVVDPLYGTVFVNDGRIATVEDLAADHSLVVDQIHRRRPAVDYRWFGPAAYDDELYRYREVRRIRWNKFPGGETVRRALETVLGAERAAAIPYPKVFERPHYAMALLALVAGGGALVCARFSAKRDQGLRQAEDALSP
jgi:hypothetical protein